MENPIKMDDLGVALFSETAIFCKIDVFSLKIIETVSFHKETIVFPLPFFDYKANPTSFFFRNICTLFLPVDSCRCQTNCLLEIPKDTGSLAAGTVTWLCRRCDGWDPIRCQVPIKLETKNMTRWWFQIFFIFTPSWGRFPFLLIFFRWVETTNQMSQQKFWGKSVPLNDPPRSQGW